MALGIAYASPPLALPAPPPPAKLYRMDVVDYEGIFARGFQTSSSVRDMPADNDLLSHLYGQDLHNREDRASNWLTASDNFDYVRNWLGEVAMGVSPPRMVWIYELQANSHAYSVNWALSEYMLRHGTQQSDRVAMAQSIRNRAGSPFVWAYWSDIHSVDIYRAIRWDFDPVGRRYLQTGIVILNPHFIAQALPEPQSGNPLNADDSEAAAPSADAYVYQAEQSDAASSQGTMTESTDMSLLCTLPARPDSAPFRRAQGIQHAGLCDANSGHVKIHPQASKARPSKLAFNVLGGSFCLSPMLYTSYVGAGFVACNASAPRFEYDEYKRLSVEWQKNRWCLAVPESVVNGGKPTWDYVHFEPCVINSTNQAWSIRNGQVLSFRSNIALQEYHGSAMLSRYEDGHPMPIHKEPFAFGFFNGPSPSRSHQVELQMGWSWSGTTYYSSYDNKNRWSQAYWYRTYYDYNKQTISQLYVGTSSSPSPAPQSKYCLNSRQFNQQVHGWKWSDWVLCNDADPSVPAASKWEMASPRDAAIDPSQVQWRDLARDPLWVQATTPSNAGAHFTSFSDADLYPSTSTRTFSIRPDAVRMGSRFAPERSVD